jgi:hypothetical protein
MGPLAEELKERGYSPATPWNNADSVCSNLVDNKFVLIAYFYDKEKYGNLPKESCYQWEGLFYLKGKAEETVRLSYVTYKDKLTAAEVEAKFLEWYGQLNAVPDPLNSK